MRSVSLHRRSLSYLSRQYYKINKQSLFNSKRENLNMDKLILHKIIMIVLCGISLEICFAILSVIVMSSHVLQNPVGTLCVLYVDSLLEVLSLMLALKLFDNIKSKEIENLNWIGKLGNRSNNINEMFMFKIPIQMVEQDKSKL